VCDTIDTHRGGLDTNPVEYLYDNQARLEAAVLRAAAAYLAASTDLALTDSTTMGLGLLYNGLDVRPQDEMVTTIHDSFATHEALRFKAG
jgi:isopenicillin-N epimerase